jgi:hypothetical protein
MQFRDHLVMVVTLLVVGASVILGVTVQSTPACPIASTTTSHTFVVETCSNQNELTCAASLPVSVGPRMHLWGVQSGCFGPKP